MTTYAIGDVQGCHTELQALLEKINFNIKQDTLWFAGDIVNRGPQSLDVLRFIKSLGDRAITVLGNHDLHLLAVACGKSKLHKRDTLLPILKAKDKVELLHWLRHRPLLHYDKQLNTILVHAGLAPEWNLKQAKCCARELENILRSDRYVEYFSHMYGNKPNRWHAELSGWERLRFITNCFTRLRYVTKEGKLCLNAKGPLGSHAKGCLPWFQVDGRQCSNKTIIFGHWSTLGFYNAVNVSDASTFANVVGIDSGCLWGGMLTAVALPFSVNGEITAHQINCIRK
ncbi:MAG: symmetrical bis(5'-nucleosyl)-tetraphosphatase [Gammaproteobacteria bacterium]|nr:symmetrical bis(5'-nucleosyl)-tetraphosphatase [Gammaproteobacteria bacterium]